MALETCHKLAPTTVAGMLLQEEYFQQLDLSSTLYIGNLSFYTTEDQVNTCNLSLPHCPRPRTCSSKAVCLHAASCGNFALCMAVLPAHKHASVCARVLCARLCVVSGSCDPTASCCLL